MKTTKERAEKAIQTICRTVMAGVAGEDETVERLMSAFAYTAAAMARHYELDPSVMEIYRIHIMQARAVRNMDPVSYADAEDARDLIVLMCREEAEPEEIVLHLTNANQILEFWSPGGRLHQKEENNESVE